VLPSSLVGLFVFVVLLAPGFVVVLRRERRVPAPQSSVFRETVRLVAASVACLFAAGLLLGLLRVLLPDATIDVGALLRDPAGYAVAHHVRVAWWALAGLAAAVLFALAGTDPRWAAVLRRVGARPAARRLLGTADSDIRPMSAWSRVFTMFDDDPAGPGEVFVRALLTDGTLIGGRLSSHAATVEDGPDRELVLAAPVRVRTTDGAEHDPGSTYTIVAARQIVRLDVVHVSPTPPPVLPAEEPPA
jgi:hypothetical protein